MWRTVVISQVNVWDVDSMKKFSTWNYKWFARYAQVSIQNRRCVETVSICFQIHRIIVNLIMYLRLATKENVCITIDLQTLNYSLWCSHRPKSTLWLQRLAQVSVERTSLFSWIGYFFVLAEAHHWGSVANHKDDDSHYSSSLDERLLRFLLLLVSILFWGVSNLIHFNRRS